MGDTLTCDECGAEIESEDDLEHHERIHELELEAEATGKPPQIQIGANKRDLYRCKGCGKILGVN